MASRALSLAQPAPPRREERIGLGVAIALHVALAAFLVTSDPPRPAALSEERMVVNLSEDAGLEDAAPVPVPESRAAVAPELSQETTAPPEPEVAPPLPPVAQPAPQPQPQPRTAPQPTRASPQQRPSPAPRATNAPAPRPTAAARPAERQRPAASRIGSDFLDGAGNADTRETRSPATRAGPQALAGIRSAITRQIKPHWSAPQGVDAEKLVTVLAFSLNEDGSLNGRPRVVSQSGVTDANAAQKALHAERAIRAVQLASPFDLPRDLYGSWRTINNARFDRSLSQ